MSSFWPFKTKHSMFLRRGGSCTLRLQGRLARPTSRVRATAAAAAAAAAAVGSRSSCLPNVRGFHCGRELQIIKPVLLADIGEGIVECEVIQWFVEPEARVEEFSPLCEVQSDKASVEITSRFSGVIKKLYYEAGEMARVGKPFVDIDMQDDVRDDVKDDVTDDVTDDVIQETLDQRAASNVKEDEDTMSAPTPRGALGSESAQTAGPATKRAAAHRTTETPAPRPQGKLAALATPAVRHLCKDFQVDIVEVKGTGKDGRVLKEDIYSFIKARRDAGGAQTSHPGATTPSRSPPPPPPPPPPPAAVSDTQTESRQALTKIQQQMFMAMSRSLDIPHFLYADEVDLSDLCRLRDRVNKVLSAPASRRPILAESHGVTKTSYLPFVIKAVSTALQLHPILNARVDSSTSQSGPAVVYRAQHNIGVAMDTPQGLLVPVVKNVATHSILTIAAELSRLQQLAQSGKLAPQDMTGGTVTISNIGSIGGTYCSPVLVEGQVAILGIGRMREVPQVVYDKETWSIRGMRQVCHFSWSADHRIVDGATMARAAEVVRSLVERPDLMVLQMR